MDRQAWVSAIELREGERLLAEDGSTPRMVSLSLRPRREPVYNIEVEGDHCYRVGQQGLLVHNASAGRLSAGEAGQVLFAKAFGAGQTIDYDTCLYPYTPTGKNLVLQQAEDACVAASVTMILLDLKISVTQQEVKNAVYTPGVGGYLPDAAAYINMKLPATRKYSAAWTSLNTPLNITSQLAIFPVIVGIAGTLKSGTVLNHAIVVDDVRTITVNNVTIKVFDIRDPLANTPGTYAMSEADFAKWLQGSGSEAVTWSP